MYGAAPYVAEEYDVDNTLSRKILVYWMRTFSLRHPKGRQEDSGWRNSTRLSPDRRGLGQDIQAEPVEC
jgi:hypothetical protein